MKPTTLYIGAAVLAGLALWQVLKRRPVVDTAGSGGRTWSQVPDQSAAETARLQAWAATRVPAPDQASAESARLLRLAAGGW